MATALLDTLSRKSRDLTAGVTTRAARRFEVSLAMQPQDSMLPARASWGLLIGLSIVVISGTESATAHLSGARAEGAWVATIVFLVACLLVYLRSTTGAVLVCGLSASALEALTPGNTAYVAVITAVVFAALRLDPRAGRTVALVTTLAFVLASAQGAKHLPPSQIISLLPGLAFAYLAAAAIRRLRVEQRRTESLLQEVLAGRDASIRAAALEQRAHFAREMHDVLAHTLSALSIQLEGLGMLAEQQPDNPTVVSGVQRAGRLAQEGVAEARRAVSSLRGEDLPSPQALPKLAADFERDTSITCRVSIEPAFERFPADAGLAVYRTAQEALTNVHKHSSSSEVEIRLCSRDRGTELTVENWGEPRPSAIKSGQFGLAGMRERAELLGGTLQAGPTAQGFLVRLWIPQ